MGRKVKNVEQKQNILIPLRVNKAAYQRAQQAAVLAHLPLAVLARVAMLERVDALLKKAG